MEESSMTEAGADCEQCETFVGLLAISIKTFNFMLVNAVSDMFSIKMICIHYGSRST